MIDSRLFEALFNIFPDAFSANRTYTKYEYANGPFGQKKVERGTGVENLAENILYTAQIRVNKGDINEGLRYLQIFKKKSVQRQELKAFNR